MELEDMNELRTLEISDLKYVRDADDAYNVKLCDKRKLTHLSLNWGTCIPYEDRDLDERVLDNLQPHNYLKTLKIYYYSGARSAIWMNKVHLINNLQEITLFDCWKWEILPPFGQLPFLKTLRLVKMPKVKRLENKFHGKGMCCVFPSLQTLHLRGMEALMNWFDASVIDGLFPCLIKLELDKCPNLQELPYLPPMLESLKIYKIGWKTLNCCSISKSIPLKKLDVRSCPNITSISIEGEIDKLKELIIRGLQSLQSLPCSLTNIISSLEFVEMEDLPQLQQYKDLPLPFKKMKIKKPNFHPGHMSFTIDDENDSRIEELEHINEIRFLYIRNLQYLRDAQDACNAKLYVKRKLVKLSLSWGITSYERQKIADPDLDERVLDNLQPHNYLKNLEISHYMGARSAIWMKDAHTINNLEEIELKHCMKWKILPRFGQLPFLKTLRLEDMPKVKRLENKFHGNHNSCVFPSLQTLCFEHMESLVDWFDASVVDDFFPCLTELDLDNCPNLQELPNLPPKLESMKLTNIGWKTLEYCCSISKSIIPFKSLKVDCPNMTYISLTGSEVSISDPSMLQMELLRSHIPIRSLTICCNKELVPFSFEAEKWFQHSSLHELRFINLLSLQSLPSSLTNIFSLKLLELNWLPQLQELPDLPPSLKKLRFTNIPLVQSLPSLLTNNSSLEILELFGLNQIEELPDLPPALKRLEISPCVPDSSFD